MQQERPVKKLRKVFLILLVVLVAATLGIGMYAGDYYRADHVALAALENTETVTILHTADGWAFQPEEPKAGFIFYPGGKVEASAYAPLMHILAKEGVLCVLTEMPLNLAVLDMNAADGIAQQYPDVTRWSIGGHSLGGAMAASYAAKHPGTFDALALLAAYSTAELPDDLTVVSIYGTQDGVLDREKYEQYRTNLPENTREAVLQGGNHAGFGSYGPQEGDGAADMPAHAQLAATAEVLLEAILGE